LGAGDQLRLVAELALRDHALGLELDVDEDVVARNAHDATLDDAAFLVRADGGGVLREQGGALFLGEAGLGLERLEVFLGAVKELGIVGHGILPAGNGLAPGHPGSGCSRRSRLRTGGPSRVNQEAARSRRTREVMVETCSSIVSPLV